jgi:hypothetical protein
MADAPGSEPGVSSRTCRFKSGLGYLSVILESNSIRLEGIKRAERESSSIVPELGSIRKMSERVRTWPRSDSEP